jgi:hypothetical protein
LWMEATPKPARTAKLVSAPTAALAVPLALAAPGALLGFVIMAAAVAGPAMVAMAGISGTGRASAALAPLLSRVARWGKSTAPHLADSAAAAVAGGRVVVVAIRGRRRRW